MTFYFFTLLSAGVHLPEGVNRWLEEEVCGLPSTAVYTLFETDCAWYTASLYAILTLSGSPFCNVVILSNGPVRGTVWPLLQERLLSEHEASISAGESKLKAAAAELRAAEASRESLQRELAASEGRLEESARLLASNQQVIKWLNKELNDAQMVPGGMSTAAAAAVAEAGAAYGGRTAPSSPPLGEYNFGGVDVSPRAGGVGGNGRGGGVKDMMFTTGIRESLTGVGVSWNLRGTTLDDGGGGVGDGNQTGGYYSYGGEEGGTATPNRGVQSTPEHGGRGVGRGGYTRIVTPESGGLSDPTQASSRFLAGAEAATPGNMIKEGLHEEGSERGNELVGGGVGGDAIRGIRAY